MRRPRSFLPMLALPLFLFSTLSAQRPSFGGFIGYSLVGGGDSRTLVGSGVSGADQAGLHLRAYADFPLEGSSFNLRTELFYNRLTSGSSTYDGNVNGKAALSDETVGLTGSFVAATSRTAKVAPYFSLGAGVFGTSLGHNPDPTSAAVTETYSGMGLGLVAGGGLRIHVGRPTLQIDWHYYQALYNTRGSSFMPISIGFGF
jgi:hypothetical protein